MQKSENTFEFKGCLISISNETNIVSNEQCYRFMLKYLSHYLAEEILPDGYVYVSSEVKNRNPLFIVIKYIEKKIKIYVNEILHIEIMPSGFHNTQLCTAPNNSMHLSFISYLHTIRSSGKDIMSY